MLALEVIGNKKLSGDIEIAVSKNASLPIVFSTLMLDGNVVLRGLPAITDIENSYEILRSVGSRVEAYADRVCITSNQKADTLELEQEQMQRMRASILCAAPLLHKCNKITVYSPGGCSIGARPIDFHLGILEQMGCSVFESERKIIIEKNNKRLEGAKIVLPFPSVGATETAIMASVLASGKTVIQNAAMEPEVEDLCNFLKSTGAKIEGAGTDLISIQGVESLRAKKEYKPIPDRIEAMSYILISVATRSNVSFTNIEPSHLSSSLEILDKIGVKYEVTQNSKKIEIFPSTNILSNLSLQTSPYPGFPTDLQPQFVSLFGVTPGSVVLQEKIFENRLKYVDYLYKIGYNIEVDKNKVFVSGVAIENLTKEDVILECTDLRAGAALLLAALCKDGKTIITNVEHMLRGYEDLVQKMQSIGAQIRIIHFKE